MPSGFDDFFVADPVRCPGGRLLQKEIFGRLSVPRSAYENDIFNNQVSLSILDCSILDCI